MAKTLEAAGIVNWRFFDAVPADRITLPYDETAALRTYGSSLTQPEVSCAASHLAMMEAFTENTELDYLVVFEDDLIIDENIKLDGYIQLMQTMGLEYMKMYARFIVRQKYLAMFGRFILYRSEYPPLGTQAYILSKSGAGKMLSQFRKNRVLDMPIDYMMDDMCRGSLPIYMLYPFPVMELNFQSTIHSKENSARKRERNKELVRSGASQRQGAGFMEKLRMKYYNFRMDRLDKEALAAMRKGSISSIQLS